MSRNSILALSTLLAGCAVGASTQPQAGETMHPRDLVRVVQCPIGSTPVCRGPQNCRCTVLPYDLTTSGRGAIRGRRR